MSNRKQPFWFSPTTLALVKDGGTFHSATGGTFQTDTDGTNHSDIPGTFESDMGGTFNPLQSEYLYEKCFPIFYSIWNQYETDCLSCHEFITDVYVQIMTPSEESGKSSLENLKVTKTFQGWLRTIAKNRCIQLYNKKKIKPIPVGDEVPNGPLANLAGSNDIDLSRINKSDLETVLCQVKPLRFRQIIELVHLQGMSNEEAAKALDMNRDNFNTKHCLARIKVKSILKEEGIL